MLAAAVQSSANAAEISGAGATFPYPIYAKWAEAYEKSSGVQLNYQSIGSGGGIKQIKARTVTFGASDKPLKEADLKADWPSTMADGDGRHRAGRQHRRRSNPATLVFDGPTLAKIFMGEIKDLGRPGHQAKLNPNVALPSTGIAVVHRSDGSGTTFNFTDYLSKVSAGLEERKSARTLR